MLPLYVYEFIIMKPCYSAECWTVIFQWLKFSFQIFLLPNPKCLFILFQYTNVHLCAKFGDLKPTIDKKWYLDLFLSKEQKQHSERKVWFSFNPMFHKDNWSLQSTDCVVENLKPWGPTWGQTKQNLRKFRFLELFSSDSCVLVIQYKG